MTDFTRYLTEDIAKIAEEVQLYADSSEHDSFVIHPKIVRKALEQIVNSGVDLGDNEDAVFQEIFAHYKQGKTIKGKTLIEATNKQDFKWPLYDQCVAFCEREDIELVGLNGVFYREEAVEMPQTMIQAVDWLTVAEMKGCLREHGQKVSGNRPEIEERMIEHISLSDLHTDLLIKYDERAKDAYYDYLSNKYERLASFISHRTYFLRDLGYRYYACRVMPMSERSGNDRVSDTERDLAKKVSEGGYDTVFVDGKLAKLLPLFPGASYLVSTDTSDSIYMDQIRSSRKKPSIIKRLFSSFAK